MIRICQLGSVRLWHQSPDASHKAYVSSLFQLHLLFRNLTNWPPFFSLDSGLTWDWKASIPRKGRGFAMLPLKKWRKKSVANKPGSRSCHVWFRRRDLGRQLDKSRLSSESLQSSSDYRTSRRGASSNRVSIISSVGQEGSSTVLPNPTWAEARPICQAWSHPETNCSAFPRGGG